MKRGPSFDARRFAAWCKQCELAARYAPTDPFRRFAEAERLRIAAALIAGVPAGC